MPIRAHPYPSYKATDAHIPIIGNITPTALAHATPKGTEGKDGTSSRYLWALRQGFGPPAKPAGPYATEGEAGEGGGGRPDW